MSTELLGWTRNPYAASFAYRFPKLTRGEAKRYQWDALCMTDRYALPEETEEDERHRYGLDGMPVSEVASAPGMVVSASPRGRERDEEQSEVSRNPVEYWPTLGYYGSTHTITNYLGEGWAVSGSGQTKRAWLRSYENGSRSILVVEPDGLHQRETAGRNSAEKHRKHANRAEKQRAYRERIRNEAKARGITQKQLQEERAIARKGSTHTTVEWQ